MHFDCYYIYYLWSDNSIHDTRYGVSFHWLHDNACDPFKAYTIHDQLKVVLMINFTYQKQLTVRGNCYFQFHSSLDNNLWDHCTFDNI